MIKLKFFSLDLIRYSDVSKFYEKNKDYNEIMNYIVNMYYPLLKKNDIFTFQDYQQQSNMLQKNNDKEVKEILDKEYALDKFYVDLFNKSKFNYTSSGYNYIKLLIKPPTNFKLNLENIFKLIHSNKDYPLIRINFGHSYDKLYRLYTENQTTEGKSIPYVNKYVINKIKKLSGRNNFVTIYCEYIENDLIIPVLIDIENNCNIFVTVNYELNKLNLTEKQLNEIIGNKVNPIIEILSNYLTNNGYVLNYFESISKTEIISANYTNIIDFKTDLKLISIKKCLKNLFYVVKGDIKKDIFLIYKKTSYFNNKSVDAQQYYINEMMKLGMEKPQIVEFLKTNFNIENAVEVVGSFLNNLETMQGNMKKIKNKYTGIGIIFIEYNILKI